MKKRLILLIPLLTFPLLFCNCNNELDLNEVSGRLNKNKKEYVQFAEYILSIKQFYALTKINEDFSFHRKVDFFFSSFNETYLLLLANANNDIQPFDINIPDQFSDNPGVYIEENCNNIINNKKSLSEYLDHLKVKENDIVAIILFMNKNLLHEIRKNSEGTVVFFYFNRKSGIAYSHKGLDSHVGLSSNSFFERLDENWIYFVDRSND